MLNKLALYILSLLLLLVGRVSAGDKNGKSMVQVLHAYEQTSMPGTPGTPQKKYQFVVVWKGASAPRHFMWRGKSDLVACKVQRAHRNTMVKPGEPAPEYMTSFITPGSRISKDDTLLITPLAGRGVGNGPLPAAKNRCAIYFNTDERKWFYCPVKNMEKRQPVMMP